MSDREDYDPNRYYEEQQETYNEAEVNDLQDQDYNPENVVGNEDDVDYDPTFDPMNNKAKKQANSDIMNESGLREEDLSELEDDVPKNVKGKGKKKKGDGESSARVKKPSRRNLQDELEAEADKDADELQKLMRRAIDADLSDNQNGIPALHKFHLLPKVISIMKKSYNHSSLLEIGILSEVRGFLEPLPDASLPILNIQIGLMEVLNQMPITTDYLRSSYLGRVVKFYSICPRITKEVKKSAKQLVTKWTQQIIRKNGNHASYRMAMQKRNEEVKNSNIKNKMTANQQSLIKVMSKLKMSNRKR